MLNISNGAQFFSRNRQLSLVAVTGDSIVFKLPTGKFVETDLSGRRKDRPGRFITNEKPAPKPYVSHAEPLVPGQPVYVFKPYSGKIFRAKITGRKYNSVEYALADGTKAREMRHFVFTSADKLQQYMDAVGKSYKEIFGGTPVILRHGSR